jgi:N-acetylglutamate synthase-like GNAT family acetyltransferase
MVAPTEIMIHISPATQSDQKTIERIIRDANINPMSLDWRRFLVAEEVGDPEPCPEQSRRGSGRIVGVGQIKPHDDGSRELASIAVIPERQRQGIASEIIRALLANESGDLYLICRDELESFYVRFGFRKVGQTEMTPYFRKIIRVVNIFARVAGRRGIVMKRDSGRGDS